MVLTVVWYPWTEGAAGPAGTAGAWRNLYLEIPDAPFTRLPAVGETVFFEDGASIPIEAVGWKLDGTAYLFLGKRLERKGESLDQWLTRGFRERVQPQPATLEAPAAMQPPMPSSS